MVIITIIIPQAGCHPAWLAPLSVCECVYERHPHHPLPNTHTHTHTHTHTTNPLRVMQSPFGHGSIATGVVNQCELCVPYRAWAVGSLTLLFLQCVTWSAGLVFLSAPSLLLAYLFSSLNTAQGLLITILHCTLARKVGLCVCVCVCESVCVLMSVCVRVCACTGV